MKNAKYLLTTFVCAILIFSGCATKEAPDENALNGVSSVNDISNKNFLWFTSIFFYVIILTSYSCNNLIL